MRLHSRLRFFSLFAAAALVAAAEDPRDIIRRSVERDDTNAKIARNYTFLQRVERRDLDGAGQVKDRETKTWDVTLLEGSPYRRLVERDDKPLPPREEQNEQQKLEKNIAERQHESEAERSGRMAEADRKRQREREIIHEIPDAFDFTMAGEDVLDGRPAWVIEAIPHPGYRARTKIGRYFSKLRGRIWIDRQDLQCVKVEAEAIDNISFGFVLARIARGAKLRFEQTRVNDEVWLPRHVEAHIDARVAIIRNLRGVMDITFRNYRKFQADSRVVARIDGSSE